jgi:ribonucleoside-diphosphate reductase beta chain
MIFEDSLALDTDKYPWANDFIQAMWDNPWNVKKFDFAPDVHDFKVNLSDEDRQIVIRTLSAIAQIEVSVKTFWGKLGDNLPPLRDLGYVMANVETIHNFAYKKLLDVLGMKNIYAENLKEPIIAGRVNYLRKHTHRYYSDSKKQYVYALILFTIFVENVSLFSQFYIMNWYNKFRNVLKTVDQQILYTKNEETIHFLVGAQTVNTIHQEYPELFDEELTEKVLKECRESINHESKLIKWIVGDFNEENLSADILTEMVKSRMNDSLTQIGFPKLYDINPELKDKFRWFEVGVMGNAKVDFFNQHPVDYSQNHQSFDAENVFADLELE